MVHPQITRVAVFLGIICALHILRFLCEYYHYRYCASSIFTLLFTHGSTTCVAMRTFSGTMTTTITTFCGLILNSFLLLFTTAQTLQFNPPPPKPPAVQMVMS